MLTSKQHGSSKTSTSITINFNKGSDGTYTLNRLVASSKLSNDSTWIDIDISVSSNNYEFNLSHYETYDVKITKIYNINGSDIEYSDENPNIQTLLGTLPTLDIDTEITYNIDSSHNLTFTINNTEGNPQEYYTETRIYYSNTPINDVNGVTYTTNSYFDSWYANQLYFKIARNYNKYGLIESSSDILIENIKSLNINEENTYFIESKINDDRAFFSRYNSSGTNYLSTLSTLISSQYGFISGYEDILHCKFILTGNQNEVYIHIVKIGTTNTDLYISSVEGSFGNYVLEIKNLPLASRFKLKETGQTGKYNIQVVTGFYRGVEFTFVPDRYLGETYLFYSIDVNFYDTLYGSWGYYEFIPAVSFDLRSPTPINITQAYTVGQYSVSLAFSNTNDHGDYTFTGHDVICSTNNSMTPFEVCHSSSSRYHDNGITINQLDPGTTFYFQARAHYNNYNTVESNILSATTNPVIVNSTIYTMSNVTQNNVSIGDAYTKLQLKFEELGNQYKISAYNGSTFVGYLFVSRSVSTNTTDFTSFDVRYDNITENSFTLYVPSIRVGDNANGYIGMREGRLVYYNPMAWYDTWVDVFVFNIQ